ncbi:hypothetical protein ILUMI_18988 [Ignelater luminosus]|uniref:ADP/ATP translocase n=1 Tax=Ignelater luminosus TaxID=2038154 RepID=A0A8K0CP02_IGNLU|nr:hypothetical protein ILUMI_18988 [Ignelater luminosus]
MSSFDVELKKFVANLVIVSITSSIAKTITAPMDRIKLILQNQDSALQVIKGERVKYKGILDCFLRFPKEQGLWSFWRGNGTNILRYFPTQALNFAFNDFYKKIFQKVIGDDTPSKSVLIRFLAGGLAGTCATSLMFPLEFCQTRIAVDIGASCSKEKKGKIVKREFQGLRDCIRKVKKVDGMRGLYCGYPVAVLGISLYRALYFGLFDSFKHLWPKEDMNKQPVKLPMFLGLVLAQSVTCISGICTYPLDTVARRLMLDSGRPKELRLFSSSWGAFKTLYKAEGFFTFYRGAMTNCVRGMSGALVLVFYDEVLHYTKWKDWLSPCDNC